MKQIRDISVRVRDVHGSEIFRTVRVRFEIPAFEPVRTCSKQVTHFLILEQRIGSGIFYFRIFSLDP